MVRKKNYFESFENIIGTVVKTMGLERGLSEVAFAKLWPQIVGERFKESTALISVNQKYGYDIMLVAVSSGAVLQEMVFCKASLLTKIKKYSKNFNYNVKDIHFSTQLWKENNFFKAEEEEEKTLYKIKKIYTEKDLSQVQLPQNLEESIKKSLSENDFCKKEESREKILKTIIKDLKIQIWKKNNGFPVCSSCNIAITYYLEDEKRLCPSCKYKEYKKNH